MNGATEARHIQLMDTTLRDGEQTQGVSFSANEKMNIARALLQSLKVDRIEVASACVSEGEKLAVAQITSWAESEGMLDRVEVLGLVLSQFFDRHCTAFCSCQRQTEAMRHLTM